MGVKRYSEYNPLVVAAVLGCLVLAISYAKFKIGYQVTFSVFYLVPVLLSAVFLPKPIAVILVFISAMAFPVIDIVAGRPFSHGAIPFWNGAVRFMVYMSFVLLCWMWGKEKEESRTDHLTTLANRRRFYEAATLEIERCRRYKHPFTVAYVDCDDFKSINDHFGHHKGDELLKTVAQTLRSSTRATDLVARLGGDEFVALLTETGTEGGQRAVSKIHSRVTKIIQEKKWPVTFSIGSLTCLEAPPTVDGMLLKADELMYSVKKNGKGNVRYETVHQWEPHK